MIGEKLYALSIRAYLAAIQIAALRNKKARDWLRGRKNWGEKLTRQLSELPEGQRVWLHAASLGEMEMALPLLRELKQSRPDYHFIISFFSPSGFQHYQAGARESITYLPLDQPKNAEQFIAICRPQLAIFVKYEIWPFFLRALAKHKIPSLLISARFRPGQIYFKPAFRSFFKPALDAFAMILTQDDGSLKLLRQQGLKNAVIAGDSRYDQVVALKNQEYDHSPALEKFSEKNFTIVGGSSWPPEEKILRDFMHQQSEVKLILAPHQVDEANIRRLVDEFKAFGCVRFSDDHWPSAARVLIIDNIGHLKYLYRFGDLALIGGGMGPGVHSVLEAAAYGLPVAFGPRHRKFSEPGQLIEEGFAREIELTKDFVEYYRELRNADKFQKLKPKIASFVAAKAGATQKSLEQCLKFLPASKA